MERDQPERPPTSSEAPIGIGGATLRRFKVLLVGDSNAVGYCETLKGDFSLRKSLSTHYDITVTGKRGTSWVKISTNVHGMLATYSKGQALGNREFDVVFTVLGTNDIPKLTASAEKWHQLEDAATNVIKGLNGFLREGLTQAASSEHPSATGVPIYVTAPFCFEVGHSVTLFCEMLQRVCKAENCHFVSVSWDQTCHTQVTTKMPLKHFNTIGVQILTESLRCAFSAGALSPAPPPELMSQSASVAQPLAPQQAPNSVQAPKPNSAVAATGPR